MGTYFNSIYKMMDDPAYNITPVDFKSQKATFKPTGEYGVDLTSEPTASKRRKITKIGLAVAGVAGIILAIAKGKGVKESFLKLFKKGSS